jgi:predicted ATPase
MQIKRLRIAGFKSFVDPVDLPVAPGLTGVVGPNGCGKSNLLEALRWTMGETSARSLRGGGMEDVIFAGTATRPPRDFAEVSLLTEVGGDEREVTRRIERGAGSAYRIDGQDVRARDVQLLFADAATGAHSPAMVSQGRIGAVIAAKPAERRAMLEEAAGIAGLHVRRREAELRLSAAAANLERLDTLIADQSQRAGQLRRQARAAERYRDLSERIRMAEARLIYARWREAAAAAEAAAAEAEAIGAQVAAATEREADAAGLQAGALAAAVDARAAALGARDRAGDAARVLAELRRDLADVERQLRDLDGAARRLSDERGRESDLARDAAQAIEALGGDKTRLEADLAEQSASAPALEATLADAERRAHDAEVRLAQAQARAASEAADARVAMAALAQARARHDRVLRDAAQLAELAAGLGASGPLTAARDAAAARRIEAGKAEDLARRSGDTAEAAEREAIVAREIAAAARASARAELAALDAEIAALAKATTRSGGDRLIDHLSARPGFERAVAAALDEALESTLASWAGAAPEAGDPSPPPGTVPLAKGVDAPSALARRLSQVFLAEADDGQPLAVGQRLVTRAGAVRRWDGFRAEGGGAAAAERLERMNRLAVLGRRDLRCWPRRRRRRDATSRRRLRSSPRAPRPGRRGRCWRGPKQMHATRRGRRIGPRSRWNGSPARRPISTRARPGSPPSARRPKPNATARPRRWPRCRTAMTFRLLRTRSPPPQRLRAGRSPRRAGLGWRWKRGRVSCASDSPGSLRTRGAGARGPTRPRGASPRPTGARRRSPPRAPRWPAGPRRCATPSPGPRPSIRRANRKRRPPSRPRRRRKWPPGRRTPRIVRQRASSRRRGKRAPVWSPAPKRTSCAGWRWAAYRASASPAPPCCFRSARISTRRT